MKTLQWLVSQVRTECSNHHFAHHEWFWKYHLLPFERLVEKYGPKYGANMNVLRFNVYLHDIAKIREHRLEGKLTNHAEKGAEITHHLLDENDFGLTREEKELIVLCVRNHISNKGESIEEKLIASLDALSHFKTPFYFIWWKENPNKTIEELCKDNAKKAEMDWKKITIPEIRESARLHYEELMSVVKRAFHDLN
ncbi:MAG: HD domain-containing protein [Candidatus Hodarchaeota archaeon]